uniref:7TM_GPCR_Srx domain-containing protein n=1 Tax=Bursaphelenchus xylophilus TaxID=6326 RepID=A0A1I7RIP2_BURXY
MLPVRTAILASVSICVFAAPPGVLQRHGEPELVEEQRHPQRKHSTQHSMGRPAVLAAQESQNKVVVAQTAVEVIGLPRSVEEVKEDLFSSSQSPYRLTITSLKPKSHDFSPDLRKAQETPVKSYVYEALYVLCFCDSFLIINVSVNHAFEATGILIADYNPMWDKQNYVLLTHGLCTIATTASTMLVVYITFQRFLVVWWPLKYAKLCDRKRKPEHQPFRRLSSQMDSDWTTSSYRRTLSFKIPGQNALKRKTMPSFKKILRPFLFPVLIVLCSVIISSSVFYEFYSAPCLNMIHRKMAVYLKVTDLRTHQLYNSIRTVIMMVTQAIGPVTTISLLTALTEYKVQASLKARRLLFESQQRRRSLVQMEEMKEKLSRFVAIFIAVKFIVLRSLPSFFDVYELVYGIESFGRVLSTLVNYSDFAVVLNSATNSFAYFGKAGWIESKLRGRLLRKSTMHKHSVNSTDGQSSKVPKSPRRLSVTPQPITSISQEDCCSMLDARRPSLRSEHRLGV